MTCEQTYCKKYFVPMMVKKTQGRASVKDIMKQCKKGYCNPGCKGTIFQNGNFPKNTSPIMLSIMKSLRNKMFKGKKSVLNKNFYEKLKKKNVACAKKRGATSGCTLLFMR